MTKSHPQGGRGKSWLLATRGRPAEIRGVPSPGALWPLLLRVNPFNGQLTTLARFPTTFTYSVYAVPAGGGALKEVAHSEGPTYQNLRFPLDVIGSTLYHSLADPQSDIWSAEVVRP